MVLRGGRLEVRDTADPVPGQGAPGLIQKVVDSAEMGTLDAIVSGRLDPLPRVGRVITLDEVPDALGLARTSDGPPRIVVHPNGDPT